MDLSELQERVYNLETEVAVMLEMLKGQKDLNDSNNEVNTVIRDSVKDFAQSIIALNKDVSDLKDSVVNFVNFMEAQNEINASNQRMFNHISSYINEN